MPTVIRPTPRKPPPTRLATRSELARMKGIGRSGVSKACRPGGPLASAVRGRKLDLDDPAVTIWLTEGTRGPDPGLGAAPTAIIDAKSPTRGEMLALTKRKRESECVKLELANAITSGAYISRQLVATHVFGAIESLFKRLLGDASKSITIKLYNMAKTGGTLEEGRKQFRDEISKQLQRVKDTAIRLLRSPRQRQPKRKRRRRPATSARSSNE